MKEILIKLAVQTALSIIKNAIDGGLVKQVQELVLEAFSFEGTGEERKARVMEELKDIGGIIGEALSETSGWLIDTLISLTVGEYKLKNNIK